MCLCMLDFLLLVSTSSGLFFFAFLYIVIYSAYLFFVFFFFFQAEDGIRDPLVTGVQTCALPICLRHAGDQGGAGPAEPAGQRILHHDPPVAGRQPHAPDHLGGFPNLDRQAHRLGGLLSNPGIARGHVQRPSLGLESLGGLREEGAQQGAPAGRVLAHPCELRGRPVEHCLDRFVLRFQQHRSGLEAGRAGGPSLGLRALVLQPPAGRGCELLGVLAGGGEDVLDPRPRLDKNLVLLDPGFALQQSGQFGAHRAPLGGRRVRSSRTGRRRSRTRKSRAFPESPAAPAWCRTSPGARRSPRPPRRRSSTARCPCRRPRTRSRCPRPRPAAPRRCRPRPAYPPPARPPPPRTTQSTTRSTPESRSPPAFSRYPPPVR